MFNYAKKIHSNAFLLLACGSKNQVAKVTTKQFLSFSNLVCCLVFWKRSWLLLKDCTLVTRGLIDLLVLWNMYMLLYSFTYISLFMYTWSFNIWSLIFIFIVDVLGWTSVVYMGMEPERNFRASSWDQDWEYSESG